MATGKLISASYVERVLLTGIVSRLVRKGVIEQIPDDVEQCQKRLRIAATGLKRREQLPDPIALLQSAAFDIVDESELALVVEVFQAATDRFNNHHLFLEPKK
ncbi:hypothetical protein C0Z18_26770 [Trinickia dabaoshanensis]|uniref:Uncharacterized protein n=1 Tax=Trinickia dabaoshanensis TaxID=564714 RepID=A0A2N7VE74_9BURK|nr:hypothetical protein C0Z18_26770 [Trinickia dabaoshanensis]